MREVITTCEKIVGQPIPIVEKPRRPGESPKLVASAESDSRAGLEAKISSSRKSSQTPGAGIKPIPGYPDSLNLLKNLGFASWRTALERRFGTTKQLHLGRNNPTYLGAGGT